MSQPAHPLTHPSLGHRRDAARSAPSAARLPWSRLRVAAIVLALSVGSFALPVHAEALQDGIEAIHRKDYPQALRLLEPLARAGNPVAQLRLGQLHYHGHGVREDDGQARVWFERAARQGLAEAQFNLGNLYAYGLISAGPDIDPARLAAQWYFEAARQGYADAQYSLGILFLTGSGVVASPEEAKRWIERAAAQGHADASAYLKGR